MAKVAVELRNVSKLFPGPGGEEVLAVDRIQLSIPDGEFFSLLGPSGCGKTTTLRMIGGFEMPTEGEIYIDGQFQGYTPAYRRPVNTVFQNYALFPHMTIYENVAFGLEMQKVPKEETERRVAEALELVQMTGMESRKPDQLSGGQQQRIALARALINHPKVLLLDEPLGALDFKLRKAMQFELKELQERVGITFVYVTHDQEEALTMSDRIGVMNEGLLLQVGSAQEIYEAPESRFVADFIGETNYLEGQVAEVRENAVIDDYQADVAEVVVGPGERILAISSPGIHPGQQVTVAFRPEKVRINAGARAQEANRCPGKVTDVVYVGSLTSYQVRLSTGTDVMVRQQNTRATFDTAFHPGDEVTLSWPVVGCKAFSEDRQGEEAGA
jgi:spermidine/putrescine transport system ATP-binding protein